jgi:hypothetical protein
MNRIELTDLMDGNTEPHSTVPVDQVAATIRGWYPTDNHDRPAEWAEIEELQAALTAEDYEQARDIAAEIAVGFDVV